VPKGDGVDAEAPTDADSVTVMSRLEDALRQRGLIDASSHLSRLVPAGTLQPLGLGDASAASSATRDRSTLDSEVCGERCVLIVVRLPRCALVDAAPDASCGRGGDGRRC
jgi:hypothetical protein